MLKTVSLLAALMMGAFAFAGQTASSCCSAKAEGKMHASMEGGAPAAKKACAGCASKSASAEKTKSCCSDGMAEGKACCSAKMKDRTITMAWDSELNADCEETQEKAFWATAQAMHLTSEGGEAPAPMIALPKAKSRMAAKSVGACENSTPGKMVKKGGAGCCNAAGEPAKFKVWNGMGYELFGCEDSAKAGRSELLAKGNVVGGIQPVVAKNVFVN